jgi:3-dehydroquinate synthetase
LAVLDRETFLEAIVADKKNSNSHFKLILPTEVGKLTVQEFVMNSECLAVPINALEKALKKVAASEIL